MDEKKDLTFHTLEELAAFLNACGDDVKISIRVETEPKGEKADGKEKGNAGAVFL